MLLELQYITFIILHAPVKFGLKSITLFVELLSVGNEVEAILISSSHVLPPGTGDATSAAHEDVLEPAAMAPPSGNVVAISTLDDDVACPGPGIVLSATLGWKELAMGLRADMIPVIAASPDGAENVEALPLC